MKTVKLNLPSKTKASRQVAVRFTPEEHAALKVVADKTGVALATMLHLIGTQIISGEIVVN